MLDPTTLPHQVDALLKLALAEDIGTGDVTTLACIEADATTTATLLAKDALVVAGMPFFVRAFQLVDARVTIQPIIAEGREVPAGTVIAHLSGPTRSLLTGERTALNVIQRLSGTATLTRRWTGELAGTGTRVTDTRKTTPGMRLMQKYAVQVGGGSNHRFGLDSGVLIKDNHIAACGSLTAAVERCRARVPHLMKIEAEATTLALVDEAITAGADIILLDNMDLAMMAEAVRRIRAAGRPLLAEASGGLTLERARAVAMTGVDLVSVGGLTHSAPAADLSLEF